MLILFNLKNIVCFALLNINILSFFFLRYSRHNTWQYWSLYFFLFRFLLFFSKEYIGTQWITRSLCPDSQSPQKKAFLRLKMCAFHDFKTRSWKKRRFYRKKRWNAGFNAVKMRLFTDFVCLGKANSWRSASKMT